MTNFVVITTCQHKILVFIFTALLEGIVNNAIIVINISLPRSQTVPLVGINNDT